MKTKLLFPQYPFMPRIADGPVIACYGCCNRLHELNNRNLLFTVLEARRPGSRCQQDWFLLRTVGEGSVPGLSSWLVNGHSPPTPHPPTPRMFTWSFFYACFCVQISPFYKDTSHTGLGPILILVLT